MAATAGDCPGDYISVFRIDAGDDDGADMTFEFNGRNICLSLFASSGGAASSRCETAVEDRLISLLGRAVTATDEYEQIMDEVVGVILDVGRPAFEAAPPSRPLVLDLHSYLYPETHHFRLQTVDGRPEVFAIHPDEANSLVDPGPDPDFTSGHCQIDELLPRYSSRELEITDLLLHGSAVVGRVRIDGREMLCKAHRSGLRNSSLERELSSLDRIRQATCLGEASEDLGEGETTGSIRVPTLLAYVTHAESGAVIGLLREWIPSGQLGNTLRDVDVSAVALEMRSRWAAQIRSTIRRLHDLGIVWGDGKASNVVIDAEDNAWLIDFGGGWSEGWVHEEHSGTVRGDEQAIEKIVKFLRV